MRNFKAVFKAILLVQLVTLMACAFQSEGPQLSEPSKREGGTQDRVIPHPRGDVRENVSSSTSSTTTQAPSSSKPNFISTKFNSTKSISTKSHYKKSSKLTIVLDPGHGGTDLGAVGPDGLVEKEYVLELARGLREELLRRRLGEVVLTRNEDVELKLSDRTQLANNYEADLFLSLHANATSAHNASGLETYYLDMKGDAASRLLAERENASMGKQNLGDIEFILSDLIQTGKIEESIILTHALHNSLVKRLKPHYSALRDHGVKKGPFYVLVGAHMPCTLAELLFIDSKSDSKRIQDPKFREEIVVGLADGIEKYLRKVRKIR